MSTLKVSRWVCNSCEKTVDYDKRDCGCFNSPSPWIPIFEENISKGEKYGECYRSICQTPNAMYFNPHTNKYYCKACAIRISREVDITFTR